MPCSEELRVRAGDAILAATLLLPDDPAPDGATGRYPNVLLLSSWLPRDRDGAYDRIGHPGWFAAPPPGAQAGLLARLAEALAARGVASLRADPRGCGASEGRWEEVTLFAKIDDARDLLAAIRGRSELDLRRSGILGHGEGAGIALAVAIGDPAVSALTLIGASARSWRETLRRAAATRGRDGTDHDHPIVVAIDRWSEELIEHAERREASLTLPLHGAGTVTLPLAPIEQAIHTPALALATMLHRSVALVHGGADSWSDPDESALLVAALSDGGDGPQVRRVPGAGHDLAEASTKLIGEIAADLADRLLPRDLPPVLLAIEEMG
ncbi:MAG: alpha/beta fold hydrolase [Chloroflexi bacterium]|nr:alpha/beta fold hydrolase [Chloroflexota bacterium]